MRQTYIESMRARTRAMSGIKPKLSPEQEKQQKERDTERLDYIMKYGKNSLRELEAFQDEMEIGERK